MTIFVLFLLIGLGYILSKRNVFTASTGEVFSKFLLVVALPCEIFLKITHSLSKNELLEIFKDSKLPLASVIVLFVLSIGIAILVKISKSNLGMFSLNFATSSTSFLGLPIVLALFGDKGIPYALIYFISQSILFWTVGITLVNRDAQLLSGKTSRMTVLEVLKKIGNPIILSFLGGLVLVMMDLNVPKIVQIFLGYVGRMVTPMALLFIGIMIYTTGVKNIKMTKEVFWVMFGRYIFAPIVVIILAKLFEISPMMTKVSFLMAVLPAANGSIIVAEEKQVDVAFATSNVIYSTLIYMVYFPIILYVLNRF